MIFPGMDPYLEDPWLWPSVHGRLILNLADLLNTVIRPDYLAVAEGRTYLEGTKRQPRPDVLVSRTVPVKAQTVADRSTLLVDRPVRVMVVPQEIVELYVSILDQKRGKKVIAIIEVVSPSNKYSGPGRESYLQKQKEVYDSDVHLLEIDLLRKGPHVLAVPEEFLIDYRPFDYLVSVNRGDGDRAAFELYPRGVRERLPRIAIPLSEGDPDVALDIQEALERTYELGYYREQLDYQKPCVPPLSAEDQAWAETLIRAAGEPAEKSV